MDNLLIISGHPNINASVSNKIILEDMDKSSLNPFIIYLDLKHLTFDIPDPLIKEDQTMLSQANIIVFQFPLYWYAYPAILKNWIDKTLIMGFAYGPEGDKLKGKHFIASFTTGGPKEAYSHSGSNHFTLEELLRPMEQTVSFCQMIYHTPVVSNEMLVYGNNTLELVQNKAHDHAKRLMQKIQEVHDQL